MIEVAAGQRVMPNETGPGWQDGPRRELVSAARQQMWGDPDDTDAPGGYMPQDTRQAAMQAARAMGITPKSVSAERARASARRDDVMGQVAIRSGGRAHSDLGESTRERAERMHSYGQPVPFNDPVNGEQPTYTRGQI